MTLIEKITLTGHFTVKEIRNTEEEIFANPFLGEKYFFPTSPISFKGSDDGFSKLKENNLPVNKNLDLKENLEILKKNGLIEDYKTISSIKENDIFIDYGKYTFSLYKLVNLKTREEILVEKDIYLILKNKGSISL
ncbi:hypothetical protein [Fusobacterium sp.]|uniref:hypothetical protein n=1 Tax=Fusobacterium sp. TaxID=68766 RepID=UPI002620E2E7|nr:hypothetical protein [Fusobacterium sp.]